MASTNKTTHYDLSQYVGSDKPTYLGDYNTDMSKIDSAINSAQTKADSADVAATAAQTAAESAQTTANTAITNAATAQSSAESVDTKVGVLANLNTTDKSSIVSAVNEVKANAVENAQNIAKIDLVNFYEIDSFTETHSTGSGAANINGKIYVKTNADQSLVKVYGHIDLNANGSSGKIRIQTPLRPSKNVTIPAHCLRSIFSGTNLVNIGDLNMTLSTTGLIEMDYTYSMSNSDICDYTLFDSLIFLKDLINHTA